MFFEFYKVMKYNNYMLYNSLYLLKKEKLKLAMVMSTAFILLAYVLDKD